ncbi:Palmitoyltransferase SWF1 [Smittium mucronatum]|uniref:Palmitoyltransferase n=1 Tax=Smittium mucronatum TaxID=133383 RepID=A0A1R0H8W6_9FUNG|nr:Palmitoyltransferase SWF1 [Smittium mucronatum]
MASKSDPGYVTKDNFQFFCENVEWDGVYYQKKVCYTCKTLKPPRSKHCSACDKCIAIYDHHCVWINSCVGVHLGINPGLVLLGAILIFLTPSVIFFIIYQFSLIFRGTTTNELNKAKKWRSQIKRKILYRLKPINGKCTDNNKGPESDGKLKTFEKSDDFKADVWEPANISDIKNPYTELSFRKVLMYF